MYVYDLHVGQVAKVRLSCYLACYQMVVKPGNKTAAPSWPDPYVIKLVKVKMLFHFIMITNQHLVHFIQQHRNRSNHPLLHFLVCQLIDPPRLSVQLPRTSNLFSSEIIEHEHLINVKNLIVDGLMIISFLKWEKQSWKDNIFRWEEVPYIQVMDLTSLAVVIDNYLSLEEKNSGKHLNIKSRFTSIPL